MRFVQAVLDFLVGKDPAWHLESLKYLERDRHRHAIDPMYFDHLDLIETRSDAGNVRVHNRCVLTVKQRRQVA